MAKAISPIRLQEELMQAATLAGKRHHRSAAEQIEYWAEIGHSVGAFLKPDDLLLVSAGLANIRVEPVMGQPVIPSAVFQELEQSRASGALAWAVTSSPVRYQVSLAFPGMLEQISANGEIKVGKFEHGQFFVKTNESS
ncbi:MAG: ParD-like antitoxin of type II toxin-antitoxin system [Candidatus Nitrotoga sp. LAW]|nr:MAG: ParD-like antitoxin of type II toxin-antitoxin system [Candidatus Nitrotoga sp. LAW]